MKRSKGLPAAGVALIAAVFAWGAAPTTTSAHFANFTGGLGNVLYYCTLAVNNTCWYDGDSVGNGNVGISHSYYYQAVKNDQTTNRDVWTIICPPFPQGCWQDHGTNFRRLCLDVHSPGDDTHCGTTTA